MNFRWPSAPNNEAVKLTLVALAASVATLSAVELFRLAQARQRREELGRRARKDVYGLEDGNPPDDDQSALDVVENAARALDDFLQAKAGNTTYDEGLIREQLSRNYSFFGEEAMNKVRKGRVVVVGCGGVGSWAAVMLVRSGVSSLRLIDFDMVTLSSLNRHAVAELADVGTPKVLACKKFFERVAPWAEIDARQELWQPGEHGETLLDGDVDWVIDAIDNITTKVELLKYCRKRGIKVFASMGAGAKCDPTRVQISDISNTYEDPLARSVRRGLRQDGITDGIPVVYSTEVPGDVKLLPLPENEVNKGSVHELGPFDNFRVRILPVLGPLPSIFGLHIATYIICELAGKPILNPLANRNRKKLYEKLLRDLTAREAKIAGNSGISERLTIDESDIAFIFEDLHRGRTIVPPHLIPQRPLLSRWDVTKPLSVENCVVLAQEDIKRLDAAGGRGVDVPEWSNATPGEVVTAIVDKRIEEARAWLRAVVS
ncbi:hypothetical protein M407DRAFT_22480 [Tulasnella calospora MUT 4182]|uniref:THIF-type NAD/FAD binding fold domain-containing protein n=1 Tax=Tulasnella calospora MUT 4182 TaxID=1051891 RepID=A0A0C3QMV3_9AGAM|nr:hypothetical protein M407DRAFT_22480 [Tulasnella calospora MUT 4182]